MEFSITSRYRVKRGGVAIAVVGFLLTRIAVLGADGAGSLAGFAVVTAPSLAIGLAVIVFGIALSISDHSRAYVDVVAKWCLIGTASMALVAGLSVVQTALYSGSGAAVDMARSAIVANALLGGAVGGTLTGIRSAANRRHRRDLSRQVDRDRVLNRILRHEVLNKLNVIYGQIDLLSEGPARADGGIGVIRRSTRRIEDAVEEVGFLVRTTEPTDLEPVDVAAVLEAEVRALREEHPDAEIRIDGSLPTAEVAATAHLSTLFEHLLRNAIEHNPADTPRVTVAAERTPASVRVRIDDDGPGLPEPQAEVLRTGAIPEYDDPSTGFGLTLVRFLVDEYGGAIDVETGDGTEITVELPLADGDAMVLPGRADAGVAVSSLYRAGVAALLAGIAMGGVLQTLTDTIPAIGGLYGAESLAAGWILHLFHSAVFGLVYVAAISRPPLGPAVSGLRSHLAAGVVYGVLLWTVATSLVMPAWLTLVGIPTPIPLVSLPSLAGHVAWGAILGGLYALLAEE